MVIWSYIPLNYIYLDFYLPLSLLALIWDWKRLNRRHLLWNCAFLVELVQFEGNWSRNRVASWPGTAFRRSPTYPLCLSSNCSLCGLVRSGTAIPGDGNDQWQMHANLVNGDQERSPHPTPGCSQLLKRVTVRYIGG